MKHLDQLPVASITFVVGVLLVLAAYIVGDVEFKDAYEAILYLGGGSAAIGIARNQAGKGKKD